MRWVMSLFFVLALGLMGCSETSCPECGGDGGSGGVGGNGGSAGIGGEGGAGGGGEPVTDCSIVDDGVPCVLDGGVGLCILHGCHATDCSGFEDGTDCATYAFGVGACETIEGETECRPGVSDCTGIRDEARCLNQGDDDSPGLCFGEACHVNAEACDAVLEDPGTPCLKPDPTGWGGPGPGICTVEGCLEECEVLEDGTECRTDFIGTTGVCEGDSCLVD